MDLLRALEKKRLKKQAEILESIAEQCIFITTEKSREEDFMIGESKIGGLPHLPDGFLWPEFNKKPLAFIAQFNLEHISRFDKNGLLPDRGLLTFFHEGGDDVWGYDPADKGAFIVKYFEDTSNLKVTKLPEALEDFLIFAPCKLFYERKVSYLTDMEELSARLFNGKTKGRKYDRFFDVMMEYIDENPIHKLFGHPDLIQNDVLGECQLVSNGIYMGAGIEEGEEARVEQLIENKKDWMLLFQIDTDDNASMMWGDMGRIYYCIKKEDLANRNFEGIWSTLQCS